MSSLVKTCWCSPSRSGNIDVSPARGKHAGGQIKGRRTGGKQTRTSPSCGGDPLQRHKAPNVVSQVLQANFGAQAIPSPPGWNAPGWWWAGYQAIPTGDHPPSKQVIKLIFV